MRSVSIKILHKRILLQDILQKNISANYPLLLSVPNLKEYIPSNVSRKEDN